MLDMEAIVDASVVGALGGAFVLLVVLVFSWVAITRQDGKIEQRRDESSDIAPSKIVESQQAEEEAEKEAEKEADTKDEQETLSDWEAAHAAAENGNLSKLRFLILDRGLHVDAEDSHAMTLLQVASRHGHMEIVKFLIEQGAAVNAVEIDNRAALHFAIIRGHISIVRFLLEHGADVNLRKTLGLTPLHVVVQSWRTELVQVLLDHGADIEAPDERGDTPLDWAINFGSGAMVQEFLERGAVLRGRDADGKRPMERAVRGWDVLKIDVLAKHGQHFPNNPRDMQRVMMLYATKQSQTKDESMDKASDV